MLLVVKTLEKFPNKSQLFGVVYCGGLEGFGELEMSHLLMHKNLATVLRILNGIKLG